MCPACVLCSCNIVWLLLPLLHRFYQKYQELRARIKANSCPALPATPISSGMSGSCGVINNVGTSPLHHVSRVVSSPVTPSQASTLLIGSQSYLVQRSASLKDHRQLRYGLAVVVCCIVCIFFLCVCGSVFGFCVCGN